MSIEVCRHNIPWESPCLDCASENISSEKIYLSEEEERIRMLESKMPNNRPVQTTRGKLASNESSLGVNQSVNNI
jgi:hypothetical protein